MTHPSLDMAASLLQRRLAVPLGGVNTLCFYDSEGPLIRVLVDPNCWPLEVQVPSEFEGYRVRVEKRGATFTFH